MKQRLEQIAECGVSLYLDGQEASPKKITDVCMVREKGVYMPDYITDDDGVLKEVRYDKISIN